MATYIYLCEPCGNRFEVIKPMAECREPENCNKCGLEAEMQVTAPMAILGTKIEDAEFNHGLGCVTKSKKHRDELAKQMNVEEIGNESPEVIHNYFDKAREEKLKKAYDEI